MCLANVKKYRETFVSHCFSTLYKDLFLQFVDVCKSNLEKKPILYNPYYLKLFVQQ